jgi:7,8-dihydropterin-6-yl-methyl-4-(beta-D-ribofuranosyl)aminobenzene 5'-phosphate synthase
MGPVSSEEAAGASAPVTITIAYDNNPYDDRLETAWGFSCVVQAAAGSILFDTGGDGSMLLRNMEKLGLDPSQVDLVVLSHIHGDHVGGLEAFLKQNSDVVVYVPASFPQSFKDGVRAYGARLEEVGGPRQLLPGVHTTGELDGGIKEQSLVIETEEGLVVITGCAHPGVVNAVREARQIAGGEVHLVLGGFHLGGASTARIESVVDSFVQLGVEKVAPCHCTGENAKSVFRERYGDNYIESGVGRRIAVAGGAEH